MKSKIERKLTRKQTAPPNLAAKALSLGQFRPRAEKDPKAYTRKTKHKQGRFADADRPVFVSSDGSIQPLEDAGPQKHD